MTLIEMIIAMAILMTFLVGAMQASINAAQASESIALAAELDARCHRIVSSLASAIRGGNVVSPMEPGGGSGVAQNQVQYQPCTSIATATITYGATTTVSVTTLGQSGAPLYSIPATFPVARLTGTNVPTFPAPSGFFVHRLNGILTIGLSLQGSTSRGGTLTRTMLTQVFLFRG